MRLEGALILASLTRTTFLALLSEVKGAKTIVPGISLGVHISGLADSFKLSIVPVSITK